MTTHIRAVFASILLIASTSACTLGQNTSTLSAYPTPIGSPAPDIETIDKYFTRCPTAEEVAKVNADFTVNFEYDPTAGKLVCLASAGSADLTALQKRAYQTIYVMCLLKFSRPLPWTDEQLYNWLASAIDGIRFVNAGERGYSYCCNPANTIVIALNSDSIILQTDKWIVNSQYYGLMNSTLLYAHEARHNEGFHHTCTYRMGDDNTLAEMGSWSIQYYLAVWIAQYGDRAFLRSPGSDPDYYRRMALDDAWVTRVTRFCEEPLPEIKPTLIP